MYVFHVENVKLDIDINRSITQTLAPSLGRPARTYYWID